MSTATELAPEVIWHDVECAAYQEDLPLWEELASGAPGPALELGCGTGRVALHLARRGVEIHGLDASPALLRTLERRATQEGLEVRTRQADVCRMTAPESEFALALAPMQLLQLLGGAEARAAALEGIALTLEGEGLAAVAIVEDEEAVGSAGPGVVPDIREVGGWLYSSLPVEVVARDGCLEVRRLRQVVAPDGALSEAEHLDRLDLLDAASLEREAATAGLVPVERIPVAESQMHVGSTVVVLRWEG